MAKARNPQETPQENSSLASLGLRLSDWFERWFPDAFALALAAAAIVAGAAHPRRQRPARNCAAFRRRLLGPRHLHDADVDDRRHRLRRGHGAAGLRDDPRAGEGADDGAGRRRLRRALLDARVARVVELQPDLQRPARARGDAPRARRGLSGGGRRGLPRRRQRVGAGPVVVGGADHGGAGVAARLDREDQRRHPARARRSACGRASSWPRAIIVVSMAISYFSAPAAVAGQGHGRDGRRLRAAAVQHRHPADARRVARVQPAADDRRLRARTRATWSARSRRGAGHHPRPQPLRVPVPDRGPAAALAAAIVRAGDRRRHHAGGRRADPVSDLRGHRADHDRRRGSPRSSPTSSSPSPRATPTR